MRRIHASSRYSAPRGFTLIELLAVIAIIAVLASILIPILGYVRAQGDSTQCSSNLRQIGIAIQGYTTDHDGRLPGPLQPLVYPSALREKTAADGSLAAVIANYLGDPKRQSTTGPNDKPAPAVTTCPSFKRLVKDPATAPAFVLNFADKMEDLGNQVPWGDLKEGTEPVRQASLHAWRDSRNDPRLVSPNGQMNLAMTWAIKDADKHAFRNMGTQGGLEELPDKPAHGEYRNALFYDWHIGKIDLEDKPLQ